MTQLWLVPKALVTINLRESPGAVISGIRFEYVERHQVQQLIENLVDKILKSAPPGTDYDPDRPGQFLMKIVMPCGHETLIKEGNDIPMSSVRCPCGNPMHWIVLYTQIQVEMSEQDKHSVFWP